MRWLSADEVINSRLLHHSDDLSVFHYACILFAVVITSGLQAPSVKKMVHDRSSLFFLAQNKLDPDQFRLHTTEGFDTISLTTATWKMFSFGDESKKDILLGGGPGFFSFSFSVSPFSPFPSLSAG